MLSCLTKEFLQDDLCDYSLVRNIFNAYVPDLLTEIADLGCGYSGFLSSLYREGYQFLTGIDIEHDIVTKMASRTSALSSIEWICGDIRSLSFPEDTFGCIILKHIIIPESISLDVCSVLEAVHEAHRVLSAGGVMFFINTLTQAQMETLCIGPGLTWIVVHVYESGTLAREQGKPEPSTPYIVAILRKP